MQTDSSFINEIPKKKRKSRSYRAKCLVQLDRYMQYISDNDAALYWKYKTVVDCLFKAPPQESPAYLMYAHSSVFRDELYYSMYDRLHSMITNAGIGEYYFMVGVCYIRVHISTDEFEISFDLSML